MKKNTSSFFYIEINNNNEELRNIISSIFKIINEFSIDEITGFGLTFNIIDRKISIIGHIEYDLSEKKISFLLDSISKIANQGIVDEEFNLENLTTKEYLSYPCKAISINEEIMKNVDLFMEILNSMFLFSFNSIK